VSILSRYIIKRFFSIAIFTLLTSILIFIVVDLLEHLDKFIDSDTPRLEIFRYYLLYIPQMVYLIMPVSLLLTTVFTLSGLVGNMEITAMKSAGISPGRILRLLSYWSIVISIGIFFLGETLVTETARERMEIYRTRIKKKPAALMQNSGKVYFQNDANSMLTLVNYNHDESIGKKAVYLEFENGRLKRRIDAPEIKLADSLWIFLNGTDRRLLQPGSFTAFDSLAFADLRLNPNDMQSLRSAPEEMDLPDLLEFIERQKQSGARVSRWLVNVQSKLAGPMANFVIVFFGVPIALRRNRGGTALGFGISLLSCFLYYGLQMVCKNFGYKEILDPISSAWIPVGLFLVLGITGYKLLNK
jgi:lipopolysaccharide export system permease protein